MNEEEKQAIKVIKHSLELEKQLRNGYKWKTGFYENLSIEKLLNLIKKQQNKIEDLKDKNKTLEQLIQGNLYEMYKYYRELANSYQGNCISKDKIREKIKELKQYKEEIKEEKDFEYFNALRIIRVLKTLLGE